jgi:NAD(P)-dependent dehydrogenase (short-subunit alcohol dehydrogenase family)
MKDRHLILTGGAGGLGTGVTQLALKNGSHLTIPYHSLNVVERLGKSIDAETIKKIHFVFADLRDEKSVREVFAKQEKVDILIHLVGGFSMGETHEYKLEDWHRQIDLNLTSTFLVIKHALKKMWESGYGRIVTVSSRAAVEPAAQMAAYSAAKAGIIALTRSVAQETRGSNITANTVLPSIIDTQANRESMGESNAHRWVKKESLAEIICFLASEKAGDLRGAVIPVYGNV